MSNGWPGWQAIMRSCPDKSTRGDMILFANSLEQGEDYIDISIIPEGVFYDESGEIIKEDIEHILNEN